MDVLFADAFMQALKTHPSMQRLVRKKVDMILENPVAFGEPLRGRWQGFYFCPVERNWIIIYLYCEPCRKKWMLQSCDATTALEWLNMP